MQKVQIGENMYGKIEDIEYDDVYGSSDDSQQFRLGVVLECDKDIMVSTR